MYQFLGIDINTLYDVGFQFYQTGLIYEVLEATGMQDCNELPTPTKVEAPLVRKVDCFNHYPDSHQVLCLIIWIIHVLK